MTPERRRPSPDEHQGTASSPREPEGREGPLPRREPSPVPRGPRPRPGLFGPAPAEPAPLAALRRLHRARVPLERVRRALQELDDEGGPASPESGRR